MFASFILDWCRHPTLPLRSVHPEPTPKLDTWVILDTLPYLYTYDLLPLAPRPMSTNTDEATLLHLWLCFFGSIFSSWFSFLPCGPELTLVSALTADRPYCSVSRSIPQLYNTSVRNSCLTSAKYTVQTIKSGRVSLLRAAPIRS